MALVQRLVSKDMYKYKCPHEMKPIGICVHNTYNDASANNEITYMTKSSNTSQVSFHVAVDDKEAIQGIPFNRNAWASGDGNGDGNRKHIHFEICYSKSGGSRFDQAEERCAKEIATLLKQYGWTTKNVKRHYDFSKKDCPHRTMSKGWSRFISLIEKHMGSTSTSSEMYRVRKTWGDASSQKGAFSNLDNAIEECKKHVGYSVFDSKSEVVYPKTNTSYVVKVTADTLNIRSGASTDYPVVGTLKKNDAYTILEEKNGWGKLKYDLGWISLKYTVKI